MIRLVLIIFLIALPFTSNAESNTDQNGSLNSVFVLSNSGSKSELLIWISADKFENRKTQMGQLCKNLNLICVFDHKNNGSLVKINVNISGSKNNINTFILSVK